MFLHVCSVRAPALHSALGEGVSPGMICSNKPTPSSFSTSPLFLKETNLKKCKVIGHLHETLFLKKYNNKIRKVMTSVSYFGAATFDALNFCLLAEGKVEAVIETNLKPFDIVPLIPIIEKAGGIVSTWNNMSATKGGNILATSNKKLHYKILKILKSSD